MHCARRNCGRPRYVVFDHGVPRVEQGRKVPLMIEYAYCVHHTIEIFERKKFERFLCE